MARFALPCAANCNDDRRRSSSRRPRRPLAAIELAHAQAALADGGADLGVAGHDGQVMAGTRQQRADDAADAAAAN